MNRVLAALIVVVAVASAGAQRYTPGRTPWGDPDLQGDYTNSNEYATPLERPERFAGKRLQDFSQDELAAIRAGAEQEAIDGLAPGPRGPDYWWLQILDLRKRRQPWLIVDPPDGRVPPLTANGRRRAQAAGRAKSSFLGGPFNSPSDLGLLERCISRGVPGSMIPVMYGNNYQIFQTPGYVVITYEIIHESRVIPVDGRAHVGAGVRSYMGDARGHWEGSTLVVETTNFNTLTAYRGADPRTLRVVERFTKVSPDAIDWTATIEDPETWERPWTIAMPLTHDPQSGHALRMPRRQLRPREHPQSRSRRRRALVRPQLFRPTRRQRRERTVPRVPGPSGSRRRPAFQRAPARSRHVARALQFGRYAREQRHEFQSVDAGARLAADAPRRRVASLESSATERTLPV